MKNWCEIFKTGKHRDANGIEKEWTTEDLDKIVLQFEEKKPKAPCVIGHPNTNNPAYGWVEDVKRIGESLYASYKDVVPQFAEWVNKGLYPNRSISLYPDFTLRHVGFLGAVPPAIKGLEEFQFSEETEGFLYEFVDSNDFKFRTIAEVLQDLRDFLISKFGLEVADQVCKNWKIEELKVINEKSEDEIKTFGESLLTPVVETTAEPTLEEFSEELKTKLTAKDDEIANLKRQIEAEKAAKRQFEFQQFAEELLQNGNITPAQKSIVIDFMELCHSQGTYDFSEGDEKSAETRFKEFLKSIKQINFSEIAQNGEGKNLEILDFSEPVKAADKIRRYAEENKISVIEAKEILKNRKEQ